MLREQTQTVTVRPFKQETPLLGETASCRLYPLNTFDPKHSFETYYVELDPGTALDAKPHQGNAEEHVYVLSGQLEVTAANKSFDVQHGNFISFQANSSHRYQNIGEEMAVAIMLISYLA